MNEDSCRRLRLCDVGRGEHVSAETRTGTGTTTRPGTVPVCGSSMSPDVLDMSVGELVRMALTDDLCRYTDGPTPDPFR
jgi:hypothetical protein